jgi:hypothetical protein
MAKEYEVDRACYERVFNLGTYESIRIRLEAPVLPGVEPGDVVRGLAQDVADIYAGTDILFDDISWKRND